MVRGFFNLCSFTIEPVKGRRMAFGVKSYGDQFDAIGKFAGSILQVLNS